MDEKEKPFHFVAFSPPSIKSKVDREVEKAQARSHAARISHLRRKQNLKGRGEVLKWVEEHRPVAELERNTVAQQVYAGRSLSPVSFLGQDKVDPFLSYPTGLLPTYLRQCLEYVHESVTPTLLYTTKRSDIATIKSSWRRVAQEQPLIYHIQVAGAANVIRADPKNPPLPVDIEIMRLKHQNKGLTLLLGELQKLKGPASDALIMAMVVTGMLTEPTSSRIPEIYRLSPLAKAQSLHLYGRLTIVPGAMQALLESINSRGGITKVKDYGMASILQFSDLLLSSRLGTPPSLPWMHYSDFSLSSWRHKLDEDGLLMLAAIGSRFKHFDFLDGSLAELLETAGQITVGLDYYVRRKVDAPKLMDLAKVGNETQHKLLTTKMVNSDMRERTDYLREMCHCAALIYSDMVLFPLPATTETKPRLSEELRHTIEKFEVFHTDHLTSWSNTSKKEDHFSLMLWTLILGAMAATFTTNSTWYARRLGNYLSQMPHMHDWLDFKELMSTFLWWDYIFDEPGKRLWWEAQLAVREIENLPILPFHHINKASISEQHVIALHVYGKPLELDINQNAGSRM